MSHVWNVLVLLVVIGSLAYSVLERRKRTKLLLQCADRLGLQDVKHTQSTLSGTMRGLALDMRFHAGTKNTPAHTTIDVTFEPCPLLLDLRLQSAAEEESVRRGQTVDLAIGDAAFDKTWIIEGAPPERVIRLLSSPALRARLMDFSNVDTPTLKIEDGKVSLHRRGTEIGPDAVATDRIELALQIAQAVIEEASAPLEPGEIDPAASTYRTVRRADPDAAAAAKVAELKLLRATRMVSALRAAAIVSHLAPVLLIVGMQSMGGVPPLGALPVLLFLLFATIGIVSSYREQRRSAPSVQLPRFTVQAMVLGWAISLILTFRGYLMP